MVSSALCKNHIIKVVIFVFHIFTVWDLRDWTVPLGTLALCLWVILEDSYFVSNFSLLHWLCDPLRTLASFKICFHTSLSLAIFVEPLTLIFFISFSRCPTIAFLAFQQTLFLLSSLKHTFFAFLSSGILTTCPNYREPTLLIFKIMSASLYIFLCC